MCVITNLSEISIARKPITYRKVIRSNKFSWNPIYNNRERDYKFNVILDAEDKNNNKIIHLNLKNWNGGKKYVDIGFHAYLEIPDYDKKYESLYNYVIIPEGAEYVIDLCGEIITNKIIVFSSKFKYILYKMFGNLSLHTNE